MIQELLRDASNVSTPRNPFVLQTMRKAKCIILATNNTKNALPKWAQAKSTVVPAIGVEKQPERVPRDSRLADELSVLYVGRLLHWKGVHLAIRAFAEFNRATPNARLTIHRDGPERDRLERLAANLGLGSRIRFDGEGRFEEVQQMYDRHDILLFPSFHDSGGLVAVEAMSQGLPVICLDLGGPAVSVTDDVGIKVKARNPAQATHDLALALERLAADPELRACMGEAGRRRVADMYDWDRKGELLRDLYPSVARDEQVAPQL